MGNMRGKVTPDPIHMMHNRSKAAQKTAEVRWVYMETMVAYNFSNGPFGKQAHYDVVRACLLPCWHANTNEGPVLGMFHGGICDAAAGGIPPPGFATPEDMQRVWKSLPGASCFMSKGVRIRLFEMVVMARAPGGGPVLLAHHRLRACGLGRGARLVAERLGDADRAPWSGAASRQWRRGGGRPDGGRRLR